MPKKYLLLFLAILFLGGFSAAKDVTDITVADLKKLYQKHEYKTHLFIPHWQYPPIFLQKLPSDYTKITSTTERNDLFLMIMGPLALKLQQELLEERQQITDIADSFHAKQELTPEQNKILEAKAQKYDVFTRLKGLRRQDFLIKELLIRVDVVPPSIIIAGAAINSDWGTSRPALLANNFYKTIEWDNTLGLPPLEPGPEKYNSKIYPSIYAAMQDYALKINSGINYDLFRHVRKSKRLRDKAVIGRDVAYTLTQDFNLKNYAGLLDYTITFYELGNFDTATLK